MPTPPYAQVTVAVNSGGFVSGGIVVPSSATIQFQMASTVGVTTQLWEIYSYPDGWAGPTGGDWSQPGGAGTSWQSGLVTPSEVLLPANSTAQWGKYCLRLTVNGNLPAGTPSLVDEATMLSMLSPHSLVDLAFNEGTQFSTVKEWVDAVQASLRAIETALASSGGGSYTSPAANLYLTNGSHTIPAFTAAIQTATANTSGGTFSATLPAAVDGQTFGLDDADGTWSTNGSPGLTPPASVWIEGPDGTVYLGATMTLPTPPPSPGIPRAAYRWKYYASTTTHPIWKYVS